MTKDSGPQYIPEEIVPLSELSPHPRNYNSHPDDQLAHIEESIRKYRIYRNVVVARDNTILAGHGVVETAKRMGLTEIPVRRLDIEPDSPEAKAVLIGDNEIRHLAEIDDRLLTEILKEIDESIGLIGTGFDEMMLANLVYTTRPQSEIADFNEAAQWVGLPEYTPSDEALKLSINFRSEEDRERFAAMLGLKITSSTRWVWWPPREREDPSSLFFEG